MQRHKNNYNTITITFTIAIRNYNNTKAMKITNELECM